MQKYCKVALLSPPYSELTYSIPPYIPHECIVKGLRVAIPLGNGQLRVAVVLEKLDEHNLKENVEIKNIVWILEKSPILNDEIVDLVEELSARQAQSKAQIFANILPQALRTTSKLQLREFKENARPHNHSFKDLKKYPSEECARLFQAYFYGNIVELIEIPQEKSAYEICRLLKDPPWNIRPNAKKQKEFLEYLYNHGDTSRKYLQSVFSASVLPTITSLVSMGIIGIFPLEVEDEEEEENKKLLKLLESTLLESQSVFKFSEEQERTITNGTKALQERRTELRLIYGITGSGKTAVYLELARQSLLLNRSVFLLAPEVALALKLKKDVEKFLPHVKMYFSHGYQSSLQRTKNYKAIAEEQQACIIVGTRSALFHALHKSQSIGLIALDEEHDSSYKQDEKFYYHAKEVALHRAQKHRALMLIGSATPDIKSFYSAEQKQIFCDILPSRVGGGNLPSIELVEMTKSSSNADLLTSQSLEALKECILKDEQAVILLNRRGYSPVVYCLDCKQVQRCPHCSITLTYHKKRENLTCHYCNYNSPFPSPCTSCKGLHFLPLGDGTEKLEEQLNAFVSKLPKEFKETKILRLDKDSTRRQGSMEDILSRFACKEASILVGTQMLSKGHHFPSVSLAIIADADLTLNFPDYRAAERTFQLLVQSAGRAGRELENGRVLIQTRDIKHYCWEYIQNHDYENFYKYELDLRKKYSYPPFIKLALLRLNFPMDMKDFVEVRNIITQHLRAKGQEFNIRVLGPVESPLAIIQNMRRYQCLIKSQDWKSIRNLFYTLKTLQAAEKKLREVRISLDIDPINML